MSNIDFFNLTLLESDEEVDQINKKFYGRYNYPWPPTVLQAYPPNVATLFVNQDIGAWGHDRLPENPKIWVAGCGTNQALLTALKFPQAQVYGTDLSTQSLNACKANARQVGVTNLHLEEKSLNDIDYEEEFDYIICTGVVHHNARPEATLSRISRALKKNGVFEFMVYNYYHRLTTVAVQKAIRNFYDSKSLIHLETELSLIKGLLADFPFQNVIGDFLKHHIDVPEAQMVDNLIQPVEYSYTVESLNKMLDHCNLEYLLPCLNQFDVFNNAFTWNMKFDSPYMKEKYYSLPDEVRWQISNLLMFNNSPMVWFYLQRKDGDFERKPEQQVCDEFLETRFRKNTFLLKNFLLNSQGKYSLNEKPAKYSSENVITDPVAKAIYNAVTPNKTMGEILRECKIQPDFYEVNSARIKLCTSGYPHLLSIAD